MDRQRRAASRVTDFKRYHLSGDLDQVVQGKVSEVLELLETGAMASPAQEKVIPVEGDATPEELEQMLQEQKEASLKLEQQVQTMKL